MLDHANCTTCKGTGQIRYIDRTGAVVGTRPCDASPLVIDEISVVNAVTGEKMPQPELTEEQIAAWSAH